METVLAVQGYRDAGAEISTDSTIGDGARVFGRSRIEHSHVGIATTLNGPLKLTASTLGARCLVGPDTVLANVTGSDYITIGPGVNAINSNIGSGVIFTQQSRVFDSTFASNVVLLDNVVCEESNVMDSTLIEEGSHLVGVSVGSHSFVGGSSVLRSGTVVGDRVRVGRRCIIGHNVTIGAGSVLLDYVTVDDDVIIGDDVLVCSNTTIGDHAVVRAGYRVPASLVLQPYSELG